MNTGFGAGLKLQEDKDPVSVLAIIMVPMLSPNILSNAQIRRYRREFHCCPFQLGNLKQASHSQNLGYLSVKGSKVRKLL